MIVKADKSGWVDVNFEKIFSDDTFKKYTNTEYRINAINKTWSANLREYETEDIRGKYTITMDISNVWPYFADDIELVVRLPSGSREDIITYKTIDRTEYLFPKEAIADEWQESKAVNGLSGQCHDVFCYVEFTPEIAKNIIEVSTKV